MEELFNCILQKDVMPELLNVVFCIRLVLNIFLDYFVGFFEFDYKVWIFFHGIHGV
jgi:hypothetical protein